MNMDTAIEIAEKRVPDFNFHGVSRETLKTIPIHELGQNLKVKRVTAINNVNGVPFFDESVEFITGMCFELTLGDKSMFVDTQSELRTHAENLVAKALMAKK
jgi:hypothetical protein